MHQFFQGEHVIIHSLGESAPGEYRRIVCGISVEDVPEPAQVFIVELIDSWRREADYEYSHATVSAACLRHNW
jgi:hypothetical protein